jgi:hypothetical protein
MYVTPVSVHMTADIYCKRQLKIYKIKLMIFLLFSNFDTVEEKVEDQTTSLLVVIHVH